MVNLSSANETIIAPTTTEDWVVVTVWSIMLTYALAANLLSVIGILRSPPMRMATSYWFILSLASCDIVMVLISFLHIVPSTALHERYLIVDSTRNVIAIFFYDCFWYTAVLKLGMMALNRFASIVYPMDYKIIFSRKNTALIIAALYSVGVLVSLPTLHPCCHTLWNHRYWITVYDPEDTPYQYVDIAVNTISVIMMVFSYTVIIYKVRNSQLNLNRHEKNKLALAGSKGHNRRPSPALSVSPSQRATNAAALNNNLAASPPPYGAAPTSGVLRTSFQSSRGSFESRATTAEEGGSQRGGGVKQQQPSALRRIASMHPGRAPHISTRELRLFFQFFAVSLVFLLTWSTWQWLPRLPTAGMWAYFTLTSFFFINNSINPTVYLIFNSQLRREIAILFGGRRTARRRGERSALRPAARGARPVAAERHEAVALRDSSESSSVRRQLLTRNSSRAQQFEPSATTV